MGRKFNSPLSELIEQNMEVMALSVRLYQAAKKSNIVAESLAAKQTSAYTNGAA